jgi:hypothetical protein
MFPVGAPVRSVHEQKAILQQQMAAGPVTHVRRQAVARCDAAAGKFTLGTQTVPISIILTALREAGITTNG